MGYTSVLPQLQQTRAHHGTHWKCLDGNRVRILTADRGYNTIYLV